MRSFEDELFLGLWQELRRRSGEPARAGVAQPQEDASLWDRVLARTPLVVDEAVRRRAAADELREELLSVEPRDRVSRLLDDPRFHSEDLLVLLLDESEELQLDDAESAAFWADLATHLAEVLRGKTYLGSDAKARAGWLHGTALRLSGNLEGAERAFDAASAHLDDDSLEVPAFLRALGVLRWEQRRLAEALSLIGTAARLYRVAELETDTGLTLQLLGLAHAETCTPVDGLKPLLQARCLLPSPPLPWLGLHSGFLLAARLADAEKLTLARSVLDETMDLYSLVRAEHQTLQGFRLEAAARARLGEIGQAEDLFEAVRQRHRRSRDLPELLFTSLEHAVVLAELRREDRISQLADDLQGFAPEEGGTFAVETFHLFTTWRSQGRNLRRCAAGAAAEFRRLCRLFAVRLDPIPFA